MYMGGMWTVCLFVYLIMKVLASRVCMYSGGILLTNFLNIRWRALIFSKWYRDGIGI